MPPKFPGINAPSWLVVLCALLVFALTAPIAFMAVRWVLALFGVELWPFSALIALIGIVWISFLSGAQFAERCAAQWLRD